MKIRSNFVANSSSSSSIIRQPLNDDEYLEITTTPQGTKIRHGSLKEDLIEYKKVRDNCYRPLISGYDSLNDEEKEKAIDMYYESLPDYHIDDDEYDDEDEETENVTTAPMRPIRPRIYTDDEEEDNFTRGDDR